MKNQNKNLLKAADMPEKVSKLSSKLIYDNEKSLYAYRYISEARDQDLTVYLTASQRDKIIEESKNNQVRLCFRQTINKKGGEILITPAIEINKKKIKLGTYLYPEEKRTWDKTIWKKEHYNYSPENLNFTSDPTRSCVTCNISLNENNQSTIYCCKDCQYLKELIRWAKFRKFEFNLTLEMITKNPKWRYCALTGLPLKFIDNTDFYGASLDRIDSNKGYTEDNIRLICKGLNYMKNIHTDEELLNFFKDMNKGIPKDLTEDQIEIAKKLVKQKMGAYSVHVSEDYLMNLIKNTKGICSLTGVNIKISMGERSLYKLNFDKIVPSLGYTENNIQIVSQAGNYLKGNYNTTEEVRKIVKILIEHI